MEEGPSKHPRPNDLTVVVGDESGLVKCKAYSALEPGDDEEIKVKLYGEQLPHTAVKTLLVEPHVRCK
jgi:hypothetical protein